MEGHLTKKNYVKLYSDTKFLIYIFEVKQNYRQKRSNKYHLPHKMRLINVSLVNVDILRRHLYCRCPLRTCENRGKRRIALWSSVDIARFARYFLLLTQIPNWVRNLRRF